MNADIEPTNSNSKEESFRLPKIKSSSISSKSPSKIIKSTLSSKTPPKIKSSLSSKSPMLYKSVDGSLAQKKNSTSSIRPGFSSLKTMQ